MMDNHYGVYISSRTGIRRTNPNQGVNTRNPLVECVPLSRPVEDIALDNASPKQRLERPVVQQEQYVVFDPRNPMKVLRPAKNTTSTKQESQETREQRQQRIWDNIYNVRIDENVQREIERSQQLREERKRKRLEQQQQAERNHQQRISQLFSKIHAAVRTGEYLDIAFAWWELEFEMQRDIPYIQYDFQTATNAPCNYWICKKLILNYLPKRYHWQLQQYTSKSA